MIWEGGQVEEHIIYMAFVCQTLVRSGFRFQLSDAYYSAPQMNGFHS